MDGKRELCWLIGGAMVCMKMKLRAVAEADTGSQVSNYTGVGALLNDPPKARWLPGDNG